MAFVYDEETYTTIDRDTGETVTGPHGFTDIFAVGMYEYNHPGKDIRPFQYAVGFLRSYTQEPVIDIKNPVRVEEVQIYAADLRQNYYYSRVCVLGQPNGIASDTGSSDPVLDILAGWDAFKQRIAEGTLTHVTRNGDPSSWFPHYYVQWRELLPD